VQRSLAGACSHALLPASQILHARRPRERQTTPLPWPAGKHAPKSQKARSARQPQTPGLGLRCVLFSRSLTSGRKAKAPLRRVNTESHARTGRTRTPPHCARKVSFKQSHRNVILTPLPLGRLLRCALLTQFASMQNNKDTVDTLLVTVHHAGACSRALAQYVRVLITHKPLRVNKESHAIASISYG
jgi:hypothetical protein